MIVLLLILSTFQSLYCVKSDVLELSVGFDKVPNHDIWKASEEGNVDQVRDFLRAGHKTQTSNNNGDTVLHVASGNGHLAVVKLLILYGSNVNSKDRQGNTPLMRATQNGHIQIVRYLLRRRADFDIQNGYGATCLFLAASQGALGVTKSLLRKGANVELATFDGMTPLLGAVSGNHYDVVGLLMQYRANPRARNVRKQSVIHLAVNNQNLNMVVFFVKRFQDVNVKDYLGKSPCYLAAEFGYKDVLDYLMSVGALMLSTNGGQFPIHIASMKGFDNVVDMMIKRKVNTKVLTEEDHSALDLAALNNHPNVVELLALDSHGNLPLKHNTLTQVLEVGFENVSNHLISHGANLNVTNEQGQGPVDLAAKYGLLTTLRLLEARGIDLDIQTRGRTTPLMVATLSGQRIIVKFLLSKGANPDLLDLEDKTAMHLAAYIGDEVVLAHLLDYGGNMEVKMFGEFTPLYIASQMNSMNVAKLLLSNGAFVNPRVYEGSTPLHIALFKGFVEMAELLLAYGANPMIPNQKLWNCLHVCAAHNQSKSISIILNSNMEVNVNAITQRHETPLHIASRKGFLSIVQLLLENGANVNAQDHLGWTALHGAAINGHIDVVRKVMQFKASLKVKSKLGRTPENLATLSGHQNVKNLFGAYNALRKRFDNTI